MTKTTYAPFDAADYLDNDAVIAEYLSAAVDDPNPDVFLAALGDAGKYRKQARPEAKTNGTDEDRREERQAVGEPRIEIKGEARSDRDADHHQDNAGLGGDNARPGDQRGGRRQAASVPRLMGQRAEPSAPELLLSVAIDHRDCGWSATGFLLRPSGVRLAITEWEDVLGLTSPCPSIAGPPRAPSAPHRCGRSP
jgi:hypothetical protein